MECKHEVMFCGARVKICGKKVEVLSEPRISHCPLNEVLYGFKPVNKKTVKKMIETKMKKYGFCCRHRVFDDSTIVPYGASEMIKVCMENRLLDCAVTVCEGAGTVITWNPSLVQEIGARLTGIIKTSPIQEIIKHVETCGGAVLDPATAKIDQAEGVEKAVKLDYKEIAVTVASFQANKITEIRRIEKNRGVNVTVFSVCNTCATEDDVKYIVDADIVCASASKIIREQIGSKALMQIGVTIPIFAVTEKGKRIILSYLSKFSDKVVVFRSDLPYLVEGRGPRLKT